jgi:hypothetical protein
MSFVPTLEEIDWRGLWAKRRNDKYLAEAEGKIRSFFEQNPHLWYRGARIASVW